MSDQIAHKIEEDCIIYIKQYFNRKGSIFSKEYFLDTLSNLGFNCYTYNNKAWKIINVKSNFTNPDRQKLIGHLFGEYISELNEFRLRVVTGETEIKVLV